MESSKRKKIIWAIISALVILGILFLVWRLSEQGFGPGQEGNQNEQPIFPTPSANFQYQPVAPSQTDIEFTVTSLAKTYAERFGSWSTDNPGTNLKDLVPLSSKSMVDYLNIIEISYKAEEFSGITTKSLSFELISLENSQAKVLVKTQRVKTKADLSEEVLYQDIEISELKSGDKWLVNQATWK